MKGIRIQFRISEEDTEIRELLKDHIDSPSTILNKLIKSYLVDLYYLKNKLDPIQTTSNGNNNDNNLEILNNMEDLKAGIKEIQSSMLNINSTLANINMMNPNMMNPNMMNPNMMNQIMNQMNQMNMMNNQNMNMMNSNINMNDPSINEAINLLNNLEEKFTDEKLYKVSNFINEISENNSSKMFLISKLEDVIEKKLIAKIDIAKEDKDKDTIDYCLSLLGYIHDKDKHKKYSEAINSIQQSKLNFHSFLG